jgi:hypothetical protein
MIFLRRESSVVTFQHQRAAIDAIKEQIIQEINQILAALLIWMIGS